MIRVEVRRRVEHVMKNINIIRCLRAVLRKILYPLSAHEISITRHLRGDQKAFVGSTLNLDSR